MSASRYVRSPRTWIGIAIGLVVLLGVTSFWMAQEAPVGTPVDTATGEIEVRFITKLGSRGSEDGQFREPYFVAVGKDGNLYVVDWNNQRVQYFGPDGEFLGKWGSRGSGEGERATTAA